MALTPGTRLGVYEVTTHIGTGGMGEVYRARDTRLDRVVAVKILPSATPESRARFEREAKAIASLQHPHICVIHDVGQHGDTDYLVLEYLEGGTLADRLKKGALEFDEVLTRAIEIADALDKAHRAGIVHRDLKPANIMMTKSGVKLLDFGLAKLQPVGAALAGLTALPTEPSLTAQGTILGTLQYMAPEQLEGREADSRTDIFALGAIVYEMATGQKAFAGKSQASIISSIMSSEPPAISTLQATAPSAFDHLVRTCLAKDPDERWQSARDVERELKWIAHSGPATSAALASVAAPRGSVRQARVAWGAVAAMLAVVLVVIALWASTPRREAAMPPMRFSIGLPDDLARTSQFFPALSADGRQLAFLAPAPGRPETIVWVRAMDSMDARPLVATTGAALPFWSADGRSIGFFADAKLKRVDLATGVVQFICDAPAGRGAAWNREGVIIFTPELQAPLFRVDAAGGKAVQLTRLSTSPPENSHRLPSFLADGRHFVFTAIGTQGRDVIRVGSLDLSETAELTAGPSLLTQALVQSDYLLFVREGALLAQPLDRTRLRLTGEAVPLVNHVAIDNFYHQSFAVSDTGVLVFRSARIDLAQLTWFTRSGARLSTVWEPAHFSSMALSSDDRRLAITRFDANEDREVWIVDLARGGVARLTTGRAAGSPVWSPDGSRLLFAMETASGKDDLYVKASDGTGSESLVLESKIQKWPGTWSPDGQNILFFEANSVRGGHDLWQMSAAGDRKRSTLPTVANARGVAAQFDPDGRWLAYEMNTAGRVEVYVKGFPDGPSVQVTTQGGARPHWRGDGKELFYVAGHTLMAVEARRGATFEIGEPRPLFDVPENADYAITRDGQRVLVQVHEHTTGASQMTAILNWSALLKK